jgi:hypothetical protein
MEKTRKIKRDLAEAEAPVPLGTSRLGIPLIRSA